MQPITVYSDVERVRLRQKRFQEMADAGYGCCVLRHKPVAAMVQNALRHFHQERYQLHAWVVMPNHLHALVMPLGDWSLTNIVTTWKKFTATRICQYVRSLAAATQTADDLAWLLNDGQRVWHREFHDRYIRNARHYENVLDYIHQNPVKAGLVERADQWQWSSIHRLSTEE